MRRKYSSEIEQQIPLLQSQGYSRLQIAESLQIPLTKVHKYLRTHGCLLSKEQRKENIIKGQVLRRSAVCLEEEQHILHLRNQGIKIKEIAQQLSLPTNKIIAVLKKFEFRLNPQQQKHNHQLYSDTLRQQVLELRKQGLSMQKIADQIGIKKNTVHYFCTQSQVVLSKEQSQKNMIETNTTWTLEEGQQVLFLRNQNISLHRIAKQMGRTLASIKYFLQTKCKVTIDFSKAAQNAYEGKKEKEGVRLMQQHQVTSQNELMQKYASLHQGNFRGNYIDSKTATQWECQQGHQFEMIPNSVQQGQWCPSCGKIGPSQTQVEIYHYVRSLTKEPVDLDHHHILAPKDLDIYLPSLKVGIEYNGLYWHSSASPRWKRNSHANKAKQCREKKIDLLAIYEDEWDHPQKRLLLQAMIRYRLKKFVGISLHARECELVYLDKNEQFNFFFERNHLDGHALASFAYGLFYRNKLIQCASFRKTRFKEWEVARLATDYDYQVKGGVARLLHQVPSFVTFSNNRLSHGNVYQKLGYKEITQTTAPSYWYTDFKTRIFRTHCRRINDPKILTLYPTEQEQALGGVFSEKIFGDRRALFRIEDYGHRKWRKG